MKETHKHISRVAVCLSAAVLLTMPVFGQGVLQWENTFNQTAANQDDIPADVVVDGAGNTYVTGKSSRGGARGFDITTIKLDSSGSQVWEHTFNNAANQDDIPVAMTLDSAGNVIIAGQANNAGGAQSFNIIVLKLNSDGTQQWVQFYNSPANQDDIAAAVALDSADNIYVAGFGNTNGAPGDINLITLKYDPAGNLQWDDLYNGPANQDEFAIAMAVDAAGNVHVAGTSNNAGGAQDFNFVTRKLDSSGAAQWTQFLNGPANQDDIPAAIGLDGAGNVYVTGVSNTAGGAQDFNYLTVKYDAAGAQQWTHIYNSPANQDDIPTAMAVDAAGNAYVTGLSSRGGARGFDFATIKINAAGAQQWAAVFNSPSNQDDAPVDIALDPSGNVVVAGRSSRGGGFSYSFNYSYNYAFNYSHGYNQGYNVNYNSSNSPSWTATSPFLIYGIPRGPWTLPSQSGVGGAPNYRLQFGGTTTTTAETNTAETNTAETFVAQTLTAVTTTAITLGTTSSPGIDYATICYDPATGAEQWNANFNQAAANQDDVPVALAIGSDASVYVTGMSSRGGARGMDYLTLKYSGKTPCTPCAEIEAQVSDDVCNQLTGSPATSLAEVQAAVEAAYNAAVAGVEVCEGEAACLAQILSNLGL